MTMEQRILIDLSDIVGIEYACSRCSGRYLIPIDKLDAVIAQCPNCRQGLVSEAHITSGKRSDADALYELRTALMDTQGRNIGIRLQLSNSVFDGLASRAKI